MILLAFLALAFLISLLLGGRFEHLARLRLKCSYLIPLALGIQVLIFSSAWQRRFGDSPWSPALYVLSLLLLLVASWLNRRIPGVIPITAGLLSNALVILANGGRMPASLQALRAAGLIGPEDSFESLRATNSSLIVEGTPLWFLGDIFAIPKGFPLANVFSVGDVLIGIGGAWFLLVNMRGPTAGRLSPCAGVKTLLYRLARSTPLKQGICRPILLLVLAGLLFLLAILAFWQYRLAAQREFRAALEAHKAGHVSQAAQGYARVTTLYRLTFSPFIATARVNLAECELVQAAHEARSQGRLADALAGYRTYLKDYPNGLLSSQMREAIAETLYAQAEDLRLSGDYEAALSNYQAILNDHADTPSGRRAKAALAETYVEWAAQLERTGDYEWALHIYWALLADHADELPAEDIKGAVIELYREWLARSINSTDHNASLKTYIQTLRGHLASPTGAQAKEAIAQAYSQWARILRETGAYEEAIARYQLLMREYADTPAGQAAPAALEETYRQWAAQLGEWALRMKQARDYDQLISRCQAIARDHPHAPTALIAAQVLSDTYQLALLARRNKRFCEALRILEALAKAGQLLESEMKALMPELICNCGWEKQRQGLNAEATALFERVIAEHPASPLAARARAALTEAEAAHGAGVASIKARLSQRAP